MLNTGHSSQIINTKYKFSKSELNFITYLIYNMQYEDIDNHRYAFKIDEFDNIELYKNETYIKQFTRKMMSLKLEIITKEGFTIFNWFSHIEFRENNFLLLVKIDKEFRRYLLELKMQFLDYNLKYILALSSNYSLSIYQLLKSSATQTIKLDVGDLMNELNVPVSFREYSVFKRKVITQSQRELKEHTDIYFNFEEIKDSNKVMGIVFYILKNEKNMIDDIINKLFIQTRKTLTKKNEITTHVPKKNVLKNDNDDEYNLSIKRVVTMFDQERKKLQPNYVRKEKKNAEYLLREHLRETKRTPSMFFDAIRWLFSKNPKAEFHRQYIMNIGKLIEHFNTLEHQAMYSKEALQFNDEAQAWYNIYKKQGLDDDTILQKLREGGYIK